MPEGVENLVHSFDVHSHDVEKTYSTVADTAVNAEWHHLGKCKSQGGYIRKCVKLL
jgi:hypothetical protein